MLSEPLLDLLRAWCPAALGNRDGMTAFTVNAEDASSSILPMSEQMKRNFPQLA